MNILNIVKWELGKCMLRYKVLFATYIALLFLVFVISDASYGATLNAGTKTLIGAVQLVLLGVTVYIMVMMPTHAVIIEMKSKYSILEKMHADSFIVTAIVRIVIHVLLASLCYGLLAMAHGFLRRHGVDGLAVSTSRSLLITEYLFYTVIASPVVAMFSLIAGSSMPRWKDISPVFAVVLYCVIGVVIFRIWSSSLSAVASSIVQCALIIFLFIASCWLYDNKYEIAI